MLPGPGEAVLSADPVPVPGATELLVRTHVTLMNPGTEWAIVDGHLPWLEFPLRPGYANVGTVIGVGKNVASSWLDRRVATHSRHAMYVVADADLSVAIEDGRIGDREAAFFGLADVAFNGLRRGGLQYGEAVVVFGAGIVGQLLVRASLAAGASRVVVVDVVEERLRCLPSDPRVLTATTSDEVPQRMVDANHGRLADVVFDATGNRHLLPEEVAAVRDEGRFVLVGSPRGGPTLFDFYSLCMARSIVIVGAHVDSHPKHEGLATPWTPRRHDELFFDYLSAGVLEVGRLVSDSVPYHDVPEVYRWPSERRAQSLGIVFDWQ